MRLGSEVAPLVLGVATTVVALWQSGRVGDRIPECWTDLRCGRRNPSPVVAHEYGSGDHVRR